MSEPTPQPETTPTPEPTPQQEAPQTSEPTQATSLRDVFAEKLGDNFKSFEKYKDDDSLINGIMSAQQMIGKKGDIPPEDADDETKREFWNKLGADQVDLGVPEFGDEYGDLGKTLKDYYGEVNSKIVEIAKDVIPKSGNVNEMLNGIVGRFIEEDAKNTLEQQAQAKAEAQESFKKVAAKAGLSTEKLMQTNNEVIKKYGWDDDTTIPEILYTLARETSNSKEYQESRLHNTSEGLQAQIDEINQSGILLENGAKAEAALKKKKELMKKMEEIMQK